MKIIYFGTSTFSAIILQKLIKAGYKPVLVVTQPDKPAGRKQLPTPPPVKTIAEQNSISIIQPEKITQDAVEEIKQIQPDLILLASYGNIVPKTVLDIPKNGALNVHPSLLPKYRGPSPVQSAILAGEEETGVTIMQMDEKIDHGPLLLQQKVPVEDAAYEQLHDTLAEVGADLLVKCIPGWIEGSLQAKPQNHEQATFTKQFTREDGHIDWEKPVEYIDRQVRAFTPWPGTFTEWHGKRLKILRVHLEGGKLAIDELQVEGKKPMNFREFLLGHADFKTTFPYSKKLLF